MAAQSVNPLAVYSDVLLPVEYKLLDGRPVSRDRYEARKPDEDVKKYAMIRLGQIMAIDPGSFAGRR